MVLYRFSCYGNTIDEREFHSGEDVYTHAQCLADQIGSQVDFVVMPRYDSVTPQDEAEFSQDGYWETETAQDDDWEIDLSQNDEWETDAENEEKSAQDYKGVGFAITVFVAVVAGITGMVTAAGFYLTHPGLLDNAKSTGFLYRQATPAPILKTKDSHIVRVRDKLVSSGIGEANSRQSIKESSATFNSRNSLGKPTDGISSTLPLDHKSLNHRHQRTTESPTLRAKSSTQLKRQKKQSGSRSGGLGDEEAIAQNQSRQTPSATLPTREKLPSGGF